MLVDEDTARARRDGAALAAAGFQVVTEPSGAAALTSARVRPPDVVVADIALAELDGYSLCTLFRCTDGLSVIPVVLMSADAVDDEGRALAECAGAAALVRRTPSFGTELAAIRGALERGAPPIGSTDACGQLRRRMVGSVGDLLARMRRTELRYRALLDDPREAIALLTPAGVVVDLNRWWEETTGLPRETLVGRHIRDFAAPGRRQANTDEFLRLVDVGGGLSPPVEVARRGGSSLHMQFSTTLVNIDGEDLVFSIGRDVTGMVAARRELEASEQKYRLLVEDTPDVVWMGTLDGRFTFVSQRAETVCGYSTAEITAGGRAFWLERVHPDDVEEIRAAVGRLEAERRLDAEYRWRRKDGEWIWIRSRAMVATDAGVAVQVHGTFADVTEYKRLGEQVRQSQKMEAVGQLTSGIAHDFNNLLAIILGNARLLLDELPEDDPRRADATAVIDAGERAAALTRQLLMFGRRQIVRPEPLDLNGAVGGVEKMLRRLLGEDIDLSLGLVDDPGTVMADRGEIEQIILNMAVNARDAMPKGGRLVIETANVELDEGYAALHPGVTAGAYVMLSVTDSGGGMTAETQRHIFEPFFTTKEKGYGTGLGLSTCWAIVTRCRGHIGVYSEVGRGTAFKVYLPRIDEAPAAASTALVADTAGHETVLLVEDDEALRRTIHRVLAARGYTVLDAADGQEAVEACERYGEPIHLVLSDMVMPGMNGPDTVACIQQRRPDIAVLFMSGYSDHALLRNAPPGARLNFIQKPFTPEALARKVRDALQIGWKERLPVRGPHAARPSA